MIIKIFKINGLQKKLNDFDNMNFKKLYFKFIQ